MCSKGERGSMNGPYNVLLRSSEMGDLAQKYDAYLRFHSSVPKQLNGFAILITARYWNSQYEWYAHHKYGFQAGLNPALIDALAAGKDLVRWSLTRRSFTASAPNCST
jgi:4-carboxymuconolactone decarboxylase